MVPHYKQDRYSSEQEGSISLGDQTLFNAAEATLTVVKDAVLTGCPGDWGGCVRLLVVVSLSKTTGCLRSCHRAAGHL